MLLLLLCVDIESQSCPTNNSEIKTLISKKGINFFHQNIRGFYGKIEEVRELLLSYNFDIFSLSENSISEDYHNTFFDIRGYNFIRCDRKSGQGGGIGLYIRDGIDFPRRAETEILWVEMRLKNTKPFIFGTIYKPPDSSKHLLKNFNFFLSKTLQSIDSETRESIIMGDISNKPDKFWNTVKKRYPTKSKSKFATTFRTIDNKMLTKKQSIADGFFQLFSLAANRLNRTTFSLTEITWRAKPTKVSFIRQQFSFKTVSDEDVLKHFKKLNRKSAMGLDEIPPLFLKDAAYVISKPLAHIIKCSLISGVVPKDFKRARVVPVYKSSAYDNFDNYYPINLLPAISKIFEKCVHTL